MVIVPDCGKQSKNGLSAYKLNNMKYNEMTFGRMEAIINKLGGEEGVEKFLSGKIHLVETKFPIWKNVKLGVYKTVLDYQNALIENGLRSTSLAKKIMNTEDFIISPEIKIVDLVVVTVKDLGFIERTTIGAFHKRAFSLGLSLCPLEVGPALVLNSGLEIATDTVQRIDLNIQTTGALPEGRYLNTFKISNLQDCICLGDGPISSNTVISPDFDYQVKYVFAKN